MFPPKKMYFLIKYEFYYRLIITYKKKVVNNNVNFLKIFSKIFKYIENINLL